MRRPTGPIAVVLALLTGAWFGQANALFAPLDPIGAASGDTGDAAEATVWRFYDAIDLLLRTGDTSALLETVAPDFIDHAGRPGLPPTRDGLVAYVASLREIHPTLRIAPLDFAAQDDRIIVQLDLAGDDAGAVLGMPLAGTRPWPSVDIVRVQDNRIAERWGDPSGQILAKPRLTESLTVPNGPAFIPSLKRLTYAPLANDRALARRGPAILLVETGAIDVLIDAGDDGTIPRPYPVPETDSPITASSEIAVPKTLAPGDVLVVPAGATFATHNPTTESAVVLVLLLESLSVVPVIPVKSPAPIPAGVMIQSLAGGSSATIGPGPHTVAIGRVTLGSGAQIASHHTTSSEMLIVDAGTLTATVTGGSARAWLRHPSGIATSADPVEQIAPNAALTVSPGATASYHNNGEPPVSLLLVTIDLDVGAALGPQ